MFGVLKGKDCLQLHLSLKNYIGVTSKYLIENCMWYIFQYKDFKTRNIFDMIPCIGRFKLKEVQD